MKIRKYKCDGNGLMLNINKNQERIPNPSYAMIHALEECFSIMMYRCAHGMETWDGFFHRKHDIRLILAKGIVDMCHES